MFNMNAINRTLLATLTVCAIAFTHSAYAQDQVKSDAVKIKNPVKIAKPIDVKTLPQPTQDKLSGAPSSNSKMCLSPIGQMVPCK
jgi:hypothetical protein